MNRRKWWNVATSTFLEQVKDRYPFGFAKDEMLKEVGLYFYQKHPVSMKALEGYLEYFLSLGLIKFDPGYQSDKFSWDPHYYVTS